ncbi:MAG TPA: nicotinate-nucleotide adenylyltransferase [Casimicrobiaceae bacterium]|nr:nicotinate-nucleotide adenylyltransferase [Casimicrobiaceae bacterium]
MSRTLRVLAILGGTFDPIHYGHLRLAADVRTALSLSEVRLIPAGIPPHRAQPVASAEHRFAMAALGCGEFPGLGADRLEIDRPGPSYTVATLEALHAEQPGLPLAVIIGGDAFAGLAQWWHWERLFSLAHFIVVERPGAARTDASLEPPLQLHWERRLTTDTARLERTLAGSIARVAVTPQPIAASAIRAELALGDAGRERVRGLLPATVLDYIGRNHLYRPEPDASQKIR